MTFLYVCHRCYLLPAFQLGFHASSETHGCKQALGCSFTAYRGGNDWLKRKSSWLICHLTKSSQTPLKPQLWQLIYYLFIYYLLNLSYILSSCTHLVLLLSRANYPMVCYCLTKLVNNSCKNNGAPRLAFLTLTWQLFDSNVTSFQSLNFNFQG